MLRLYRFSFVRRNVRQITAYFSQAETMPQSVMSVATNQILHGDCLKLMSELPDECVDLVVTSPPYGEMRTYGGHKFDAQAVIQQLCRVTAKGGVVVWVVQDQVKDGDITCASHRHVQWFHENGMRRHDRIVLTRSGRSIPAVYRYGPGEDAWVFSNGKPRVVNLLKDRPNQLAGKKINRFFRDAKGHLRKEETDDRISDFGVRSHVWQYNVGRFSSTPDQVAFGHPAIMSESMAEDFIKSFSNPGDLVLDPMCGSGTTCKMAALNRRSLLGMEIHQPYVKIAEERLSSLTNRAVAC